MTRAESRLGLSQFSPPNVYTDNPCLNGGYGISVGYADRAIMPQGMRGRLMGRIVLALTAAMACRMSSKPSLGAHDLRLWPRRHPRPRLTKH